VTIHDKDGNVVAISDSRIFDNMVIHNALLSGLELEGISFDGSDLQGSDFTDADLYGANLADSNFDSCIFVRADLRDSFIYNVSFANADLTGARFSLSNMKERMRLHKVNFTNAKLDGTDFTGAIYDAMTIFPEGFIAEDHGLTSEEAEGEAETLGGQISSVPR
jgi:uncharacterized protein YjbI with pentapeptide repeats